ncbi:hypothetical protein Tco_0705062 [Tanacetum coccineum]|uniref:Uncharacterized protein n=1 Tax=Tanacetum coccineum TaxID=301880 RepID=A0ABQ4Y3P6_9ASTR
MRSKSRAKGRTKGKSKRKGDAKRVKGELVTKETKQEKKTRPSGKEPCRSGRGKRLEGRRGGTSVKAGWETVNVESRLRGVARPREDTADKTQNRQLTHEVHRREHVLSGATSHADGTVSQ